MLNAIRHYRRKLLLVSLYVGLLPASSVLAQSATRPKDPDFGIFGPSDPTDPNIRQTEILGMRLSQNGDALLVESVSPKTPADDAGIKKGDRLTSLGGHKVTPLKDLMDYGVKLVQATRGGSISVELLRGGEKFTLAISSEPKGQPAAPTNSPGPATPSLGQPPPGQASIIVGLVLREAGPDIVSIAAVAPGGPAAVAGLHRDDVIVAVDGMLIRRAEQFVAMIGTYRVGEQIVIQVKRSNVPVLLKLSLVPRLMDLAVLPVQQSFMLTQHIMQMQQRQIEELTQQVRALEMQLRSQQPSSTSK